MQGLLCSCSSLLKQKLWPNFTILFINLVTRKQVSGCSYKIYSNYLTYHTLQKDKVSNLQKLVVEKLLEYKKVLIHEMYFFQAVCLKSLCEPKSDCKRNGFM